jgi:hypothetical protein
MAVNRAVYVHFGAIDTAEILSRQFMSELACYKLHETGQSS